MFGALAAKLLGRGFFVQSRFICAKWQTCTSPIEGLLHLVAYGRRAALQRHLLIIVHQSASTAASQLQGPQMIRKPDTGSAVISGHFCRASCFCISPPKAPSNWSVSGPGLPQALIKSRNRRRSYGHGLGVFCRPQPLRQVLLCWSRRRCIRPPEVEALATSA